MLSIPLAAAALYRHPLDFQDGRLLQGTLFPLFDEAGKVHKLVLVNEEEAKISVIDWQPGLVDKPLFRPIRLKLTLNSLDDLTALEAHEATGWWHYDPWWLLTEDHLKGHPATPALKTTNAVNDLENVPSISFSRDLGKVLWMNETVPEGVQLKAWDPQRLPRRTIATLDRGATSTGWRLRPFWER